MSSGQGNIFFNKETLAFSSPLILICGSYAYFKYVPLTIGLPILGSIFVIFQIRAQIQAHRGKKVQNMDEKAMSDLVSELQGGEIDEKAAAKKKLQLKKKAKVEQRLAAERKKYAKNKNKAAIDDDDDDDNLEAFAKVSKKKKN